MFVCRWVSWTQFKGILNIEHFLKKAKYEKLGFSEMNYLKKFFFCYLFFLLLLIFVKIWSPVFAFYFWLINLWRNNEHGSRDRNYRSSLSQIFFKIGVLENFTNFTGKHLCWSLFLIKLQVWKLNNLLRRDSNTGAVRKKLQKQSFANTLQKRCS